jgi:flagellar hook protein FlgE
MFLFSANNATTSAPGAQPSAFGDIGVDVGNGRTMGLGSVDTSLFDHLIFGMATENEPGMVFARGTCFNGVQASITQPHSPFAMAVAGPGFFAASHSARQASNKPAFDWQQYSTPAGDFSMNACPPATFNDRNALHGTNDPKATVISISGQTLQTTLTVVT